MPIPALLQMANACTHFLDREGAASPSTQAELETSADTQLVWNGPVKAIYGSPIRYESELYIIARGILSTVDTATGKRGFQMRLKGERKTGNSRFGSLDYASPIVVGDRLFYLNASGQVYVFQLGSSIELLAVNEVTSEKEIFWGSPAASDGRLFLRSSKYLYCIADSDLANSPAPVVPKIRTISSVKGTDLSLATSKPANTNLNDRNDPNRLKTTTNALDKSQPRVRHSNRLDTIWLIVHWLLRRWVNFIEFEFHCNLFPAR